VFITVYEELLASSTAHSVQQKFQCTGTLSH